MKSGKKCYEYIKFSLDYKIILTVSPSSFNFALPFPLFFFDLSPFSIFNFSMCKLLNNVESFFKSAEFTKTEQIIQHLLPH